MRLGWCNGRKAPALTLGVSMVAFGVVAFGAAWVAPALWTPAWAGDEIDDDSPSWTDSIGNSIKNTFSGAGKAMGLNKPTAPPVPEAPSGCPTIAVLDGTQAQRVMAPGAIGNDGLRYQYSIYNVGRECAITGGRIAIKVGADGRVLLGPAGAAGHFDVPIRVVIFSEVEQKPVESKLYKVSASIPSGQAASSFQFVSDSLVVPVAAGRSAADYSIKVGIDGAGSKGGDVGAPKTHHHHQKAAESAAQ